MSAHTPGPWKVTPDSYVMAGYLPIIGVARVITHPKEFVENARLIAAAPDLLEALKELVAEADEHPGWEGHAPDTLGFQMARDAIAKAEGR